MIEKIELIKRETFLFVYNYSIFIYNTHIIIIKLKMLEKNTEIRLRDRRNNCMVTSMVLIIS